MPPKCHWRFLAFKKQSCRQEACQIQNSKEKVREITRQYTTLVPRRLACSSSLPAMLDIGDTFARFTEGRISSTGDIARDADLYGKRSRHWSTADRNSILVWIALTWLALSINSVYWRDEWLAETTIQDEEWSVYDAVSAIFTILRLVQICLMFHRSSPPAALLVVPALCNIPSTLAMEILKYNIIHCQVAWINH